jgi:hypothetical protein
MSTFERRGRLSWFRAVLFVVFSLPLIAGALTGEYRVPRRWASDREGIRFDQDKQTYLILMSANAILAAYTGFRAFYRIRKTSWFYHKHAD